ncbi:TetR family transcriptional regulator [Spiractinospora alimapuensis]|uniref:TetR/AcrR family transcriptional regulator n=1 Tax=Spiractinospora alimapuensis TaxID=2820884 RepID=UPI001F46562D|nr:TetR family transcriptional regulator [Spiractinospora alimapuensis]QVQ52284.1 TetR family transcriptional regulator [Spiractinospora alimapuensis]QVQ52303.1 TetR family transcriptional regulator [Spiractinospora alimapuensis]
MTDWRERKRERTRAALREAAFRLFAERGYEDTTVADIAAQAGVSHMTFFRYFPTKEDVVLRDDYDPMLEELVRAQPSERPPLRRVRDAVMRAMPEVYERDREALLLRSRLLLDTPALRARMGESLRGSQIAFERGLCDPPGTEEVPMAVRVVAAACVSVLTTAITIWVEDGGGGDLPTLMGHAFDTLEAAGAQGG